MKDECLICSSPLVYLNEDIPMECVICHKKELSKTRCVNGHYVCNECHTNGIDSIFGVCLTETSKNPAAILDRMMKLPFCHMHGPEHHIMVGAALLTAYKNAGGKIDLPESPWRNEESRAERPRRRVRILGRVRCGHQRGNVRFDHLRFHASCRGTMGTFQPDNFKIARRHRHRRRSPLLQTGS